MSFTDEVKHEISRIRTEEIPELAALVRMDGSIQIINKNLALTIRIYHGDLARKVFSIIKDRFNLKMEIMVSRHQYFSNQQNIYELFLPPQEGLRQILYQLGIIDKNSNLVFTVKQEFINNRKLQKAYIRGAFLGGGSVNKPGSEYHLEFRCEHQSFAEDLIMVLKNFDLEGHLNIHNKKYIVYFKSFEDITTILNIIGAHQAQLKLENKRVFKDIKNDINRRVNFETANLDKVVQAAMEQIEDIEIIEKNDRLNILSAGLKEIARLRRNNPYTSLKELGEMLDPPLSKSGVNHRLRRIKKIADKIRGDI